MSRHKRKKYACDFETTTNPNDCRVWGYGVMEIGNENNYHIDNSIEKFMNWCKETQADLYFHNLKFDGSFIVSWLLNNGFKHDDSGLKNTFDTVISNMGQWYKIEICYGYKGNKKLQTTIYDSLKKLPFSVDRIGKAFKLSTLKIKVDQEFYTRYRPIGHKITDEEYEYIKHDIKVIAGALKTQFEQGLTKMTAGSDSLSGYKASISNKLYKKMFPTFTIDLDSNLRLAYKGGFTWLNKKYAHKDLDSGIVFDVNSLYPAMMYYKLLPFGEPIPYKGEYKQDDDFPLYIQHIKCEFSLKDNHIPTIQIKRDLRFNSNEYLETSKGYKVDLYVTNVDLELIKKHYDLYDLEYIQGWKFRGKKEMFKNFIDRWTMVKMESAGAIRELAKLMLNSLYGKFATNPDVTKRIPYLKENGALGFEMGKEDFKDPEYTPLGAFITAYARNETITTAQLCYDRIIYCDTDSVHLVGTEIPEILKDRIDPKKMGYWDYEATFLKGRYLRQKTYAHYICKKYNDEGKVIPATNKDYDFVTFKVTCSGMSDTVKEKVTWNNFHVGFKSYGSLRGKQVDGGVVLIDREFSIK